MIGVPDVLAGEVPVAIVKLPEGLSKAELRAKASRLGPRFILDAVYTLDELKLESLPVTSIGKVKKGILKDVVTLFRQDQKMLKTSKVKSTGKPKRDALAEELLEIWEEVTGTRPAITDSMGHFADSINLLRYCDAIFRSCGKRLYLQDVVEHDTIAKQADLLRARAHCKIKEAPGKKIFGTRKEELPLKSSQIFSAKQSKADITLKPMAEPLPQWRRGSACQDLFWEDAEAEIQSLGLGSSVIEDAIPIRDSLHRMAMGQRSQSYHVRMVFQIHHASCQQTRRGLEKALNLRAMLRTVLFKPFNGVPCHLVIGPSHQLLEKLISQFEVKSDDEAKEKWQEDSAETHSSGLMFHADIIKVRDSGKVYLSMLFDHSVVDALSLWPWHQDLDRLIHDINAETMSLTPFRLFSDLFSQYQDSLPAQQAVAFHVKQIRGISRLRRALWPVQKAPGWMISNDEDSSFVDDRRRIRNEVWNGEWESRASTFRYPRLGRVVCLPQLRKLKKYGIEPCLFAKCAIVLFNVLQTGSSHAVFNTWESGRSWPFVPKWMESLLPPAMSIDGPTVQWILNITEVMNDETVLDLFQRMIVNAETASRYEHVPWQKVVEELSDEGHIAVDASFRQSFVWDVSLGLSASKGFQNDFRILDPVSRLDWADW